MVAKTGVHRGQVKKKKESGQRVESIGSNSTIKSRDPVFVMSTSHVCLVVVQAL